MQVKLNKMVNISSAKYIAIMYHIGIFIFM